MKQSATKSHFKTKLFCPLKPNDNLWAFVILPKSASVKLPRRGRTSVEVSINSHAFSATLEPDGQLSHWLRFSKKMFENMDLNFKEWVEFDIMSVEQEPEPDIPADFKNALSEAAEAVWNDTTTIARIDWVHWITSAKQAKTRVKRIKDACEMLASGKRRVCCFDQSGFYSKALSAPKVADKAMVCFNI